MATIALQKKMNATMNELQLKSDVHIRQMIREGKRVDDLEHALRQAEEQIKNFRLSAKETATSLMNEHRNTQLAKKAGTNQKNIRTDGVDASRSAEKSQLKLISNLEHKLDKLKIRLSQSDHQNDELKSEIDNLRRHRITADNNRKRISTNITKVQQQVDAILQRSHAVTEARESILEETKDIQKNQAEEREKFIEKMRTLAEYIEKQHRDFEESITAAAAGIETTEYNQDDQHNTEKEFFITRGSMTIEEEQLKMDLVAEIESQIASEKASIRQTQKKIDKYQASFDQLKKVSDDDNIDDVVRRYVQTEEETFSLFNYVQAQNQETDWALERCARLEEDIRLYEEHTSNEEAQRAEAMAELQGKWRSAKEATDESTHAAQEAQRTLDRLAKKIQSLFFKIQCDQLIGTHNNKSSQANALLPHTNTVATTGLPSSNGEEQDSNISASATAVTSTTSPSANDNKDTKKSRHPTILNGANGVTESNILLYAELIERRALEIMSEYVRSAQNDRSVSTVLDPSKSLIMNLSVSDYIKPIDISLINTTDDDHDILTTAAGEDDEERRPIALDEMRRRTAELLAKKQSLHKSTGFSSPNKRASPTSKQHTPSRNGNGLKPTSLSQS